jgi:chromate transporter
MTISEPHGISLGEATRTWARIALLSFGGPVGQIAVMHRILVEEKKWIGEERFLHALNFCMLLPGPEAQQLAIYIGWLLHRTKGGLVAGILFVLPGLISIMVLSWIYVLYGNLAPVAGLLFGLKAAVLAIVFEAVVRIGRRALGSLSRYALAGAAFAAIFLLRAPFPLVVLGAATIGWISVALGSKAFSGAGGHAAGVAGIADEQSRLGATLPGHARPQRRWLAGITSVLLAAWLGPVLLLIALLGPDNIFSAIALFFSQMAVVTFGGAYAVLAYVAQAAVDSYHWLRPTEMLDGLGLAETTPGPLIMVTQFVGFLGAYRNPGMLPPLVAGTLGGLLTTWVTFVPCFLWIFLGAPFIERLRADARLAAALAAVTAAVVGVILNLALWFALHFLFTRTAEHRLGPLVLPLPDAGSLDPIALALAAAALVAVFRFKAPILWVLAACALGGLAIRALAAL